MQSTSNISEMGLKQCWKSPFFSNVSHVRNPHTFRAYISSNKSEYYGYRTTIDSLTWPIDGSRDQGTSPLCSMLCRWSFRSLSTTQQHMCSPTPASAVWLFTAPVMLIPLCCFINESQQQCHFIGFGPRRSVPLSIGKVKSDWRMVILRGRIWVGVQHWDSGCWQH